ncbi:MAG: YgjV family protein [Ruminococcaceae bacterium]|nr:YgjV family protein [Oscillospiraceae bacterium]
MSIVLIGNILSFAGCILMVLVGLIKDKGRILSTQCVQFALQAAANLTLGGISGFISNIVSLVRNLVYSRCKITLWLKIGFIALQLLLAFGSLGEGIVALLPITATVLFTWFLDTESGVKLKIVIISAQILWLIYDLLHLNYVAVAFDAFTMVSNVIGIFLILNSSDKKQ